MDVDPFFRCEVIGDSPSLVVALIGELDAAASDGAWDTLSALIDDDTEELVFDVSGLTFIDSRGLSVLIRAWKALGASSDRLITLRDPRDSIRRTLDAAGLGQAFEIA